MNAREPQSGATWVTGHVGRACRCTGQCGRKHHDGACARSRKLTAAPADLSTPLSVAAALPVDQLMAWCEDCRMAAERIARRKADDEREAAAACAQADLLTLIGEAAG